MINQQEMESEFTAFFPFCGLGAGAMGFLNAQVHMFGRKARFRSVGGIDIDEEACLDFARLTHSPALCGDIFEMTPNQVRAFAVDHPDVIFASPPCKGYSGLLSKKSASLPKYQKLNRLVVRWVEIMLGAWSDRLPRLLIMENVPRIKSRGAELLEEVRQMLRPAGYVFHEGFHDCGEIGGLAQHRRRFLMVARLENECPPFLYRPPIKRVRACGEVLEKLPIPGTKDAGRYGKLHTLPKISWLNWVRLALIPAGGDWRDLPGVLEEGQARREVHKRYEVSKWENPTGTICGSHGSNAAAYVADPRPAAEWRGHTLGVRPWDEPSGVITGRANVSTGKFSVADPRVKTAYDHGYRVLKWTEPSFTVAGKTGCGCGAYQVADPRVTGDPMPFDELIILWDGNPMRPPPFTPVIISPDGCWHRPLTTLELAALQGLPVDLGGHPLKLEGRAVSRWRERIGNAVPVQAAEAIAMKMLVSLVENEMKLQPLIRSGDVWVRRNKLSDVISEGG